MNIKYGSVDPPSPNERKKKGEREIRSKALDIKAADKPTKFSNNGNCLTR